MGARELKLRLDRAFPANPKTAPATLQIVVIHADPGVYAIGNEKGKEDQERVRKEVQEQLPAGTPVVVLPHGWRLSTAMIGAPAVREDR